MKNKKIIYIGVAVLALLGLYWLRPMFHAPLMFFYKNPLIWQLPIVVFFVSLFIFCLPSMIRKAIKKKEPPVEEKEDQLDSYDRWASRPFRSAPEPKTVLFKNNHFGEARPAGALIAALTLGFLASIFGATMSSTYNNNATYQHYSFETIDKLPPVGSVRILPKEVAEQMSSSGYNSSTTRLDQSHIVVSPDGDLQWSFASVPNGTVNYWRKNISGVATQSTSTTTRSLDQTPVEFQVGPNMGWTDNIRWQLYKKDILSEISETVFILTKNDGPLMLAPYIKYEGFWTKVPVLGGIYVVHPNGKIEDLSPEEAALREDIANSGRLFPEQLALSIQDSYKYKGGILNKIFTHKDQIEISEDIGNSQPYLMSFEDSDPKWVTTAKPRGRAYATSAIFFTDTVTGSTEIWRAPEDASLSGNQRALDTVKGLAIPGVLFNKFQAIEPRPLIHNGELQFVVSVAPNSFNTVTKTVVVDAQTNKTAAIFNHDTDPKADAALKAYMNGDTAAATSAEIKETDVEETDQEPESTQDTSQKELIKRLIKNQAEQQQLLKQLAEQVK